MSDLIKPGHTSLNMDDIEQDLVYTRHFIKKVDVSKRVDNDIQKPVKNTYYSEIVNADDTDLVGRVPSSKIAISLSGDRYTVENAVHLKDSAGNLYTPDSFATAAEGAAIQEKSALIAKHYGNDITDLRDELYQLKHELEKKGIIRNTNQHFGYNDIFRNGYKPYEYQLICTASMDCPDTSTIILPLDVVAAELDEGDYIVIHFADVQKTNVRQIKSIALDGETITLSAPLDSGYNLTASNIEIYKTYGVSRDGNFYFAKDEGAVVGDTIMYSGLDDDTAYKYRRPIMNPGEGYGYSFRIPEFKLGYLTNFEIYARSISSGMPTLRCYIMDEQDMPYFRNPGQMENLYRSKDIDAATGELKCHFFAKSQPIQIDPAKGSHIVSFDFFDTELSSFPLLTRKDTAATVVRYVAVIIGEDGTDASNYAEIYFLQDRGTRSDLQINNVVYSYTEQGDFSASKALSVDSDMNDSDLFYAVKIREKLEDAMDPVKQGLYSAKMNCSYPQGISRARLTLRFRREGGLWTADLTEPGIVGGGVASLPCKSDPVLSIYSTSTMGLDENIVKPLELRDPSDPTDTVQYPDLIIGNTLTHGNASLMQIDAEDPVYCRLNDMVYRNAYVVSVKGKLYEYDAAKKNYVVTDQKKIYLKPLAVIPDGIKYAEDIYSDRVIFEGDFTDSNGDPMFFNQLELQIYWQKANFNENDDIKMSQMAIIHDLIFSTDCKV